MLCLFLSIIIFYHLNNNEKYKYLLIVLLGLLLSFSVGTRPQYILFIPIFYSIILYIEYIKSNKNNFIEITFLFFTPCVIYGIIIATYNYLRFDSFIEFGWKYQENEFNQNHYFKGIQNLILGIKYNFFKMPYIGTKTVFSLIQSEGHSGGNEIVSGIFYSFPLLLDFIFVFHFFKYIVKKNKNIFICLLFLLFIAIINFTITSLIGGIITRYVFEYLSILVIVSLLIFYYLLNKQKNYKFQLVLYILFITIFIFSMYINISLLFCEKNSIFFNIESANNYETIINFLF
jgi:hypothetical protein